MQGYKAVICAVFWLLALGAIFGEVSVAAPEADDTGQLKAQVRLLTTQNKRLTSALAELNKRVEELEKEVARLERLVEKAAADAQKAVLASKQGTDAGKPSPETAPAPEAGDEGKPGPKPTDADTAVIKAIADYKAAVKKIDAAEATTLKNTQEWLTAAKKLDAILRRNRVTISYEITDVQPGKGYATVYVKNAAIRSSDPAVPDLKLDVYDRRFQIVGRAEEAAKISRKSSFAVRGMLATNVNFTKLLREQPSLYSTSSYGKSKMPGYRRIGGVRGLATPKSVHHYRIYLMIKYPLIEIDGRIRRLKER